MTTEESLLQGAAQSLLGHLNHACKVVAPGRSFISRLITLLTNVKWTNCSIIRLSTEARSDITWWHTFVQTWNGVSLIRNIDLAQPNHELWSDASGSWGAGAFWESEWFQVRWPQLAQSENIAAKELVPIAIACATWGHHWARSVVRANCDNEAVVSVINSGYTRDPLLSHLMRCVFFFSARHEFTLTAKHIPGRLNTLADALSRNNASHFLSSHPQANP